MKHPKKRQPRDKSIPVAVPVPIQPKPVMDLREMEELCAPPVEVDMLVKGKPFRMTGRRLLPSEQADVRVLLERTLPPVVPGATDKDEPRYDYEDEPWKLRRELNRRRARALVLWRAFPLFQERAKAAGLEPAGMTGAGINDFIENLKLDDDILEAPFRAVMRDIAEVQEYVNFTFGSSSRKS